MKYNHSIFLIFAICVTVFVVAIYGSMYYMVTVSVENTAKIYSFINSSKSTKEQENKILEVYKSFPEKWHSIQNLFVRSDKVVEFIEEVELLSEKSGAKVSIASIESDNLDTGAKGREGAVRLRINSSGPWPNVMRSLMLAENLPFKVTVNNVSASSVNKSINNNLGTSTISDWNISFDLQAAMISVASTSAIIK